MSEEIAICIHSMTWDDACKDYSVFTAAEKPRQEYYIQCEFGELYEGKVMVLRATDRPVPQSSNPKEGFIPGFFYWEIANE